MPTLTPRQDTIAGIKIELYESADKPTISIESARPYIDCEIIYDDPTTAEQAYAEIKSILPALSAFLADANAYASLLTAKPIEGMSFFVNPDRRISAAYVVLGEDRFLFILYDPSSDLFTIEPDPADDQFLQSLADYVLSQSPYLPKLKPLFRALAKAKDTSP
ncbi:MAG: hypothetical protein DRQ10_04685 [Candidatus Hydrothermota bacterium]|nr:MAG: hypothetical protein DRQ10_04685 [Candidatus Hydrothermae bacterium]